MLTFRNAIHAYEELTGRKYEPGDITVSIPLDALVFADYQQPWTSLEDYKRDRCIYDPETNAWLIAYVTEVLIKPTMPPIFIDILEDGVALVDGVHRVTANLIAGKEYIFARLNKF